jgi:hypothetical protein
MGQRGFCEPTSRTSTDPAMQAGDVPFSPLAQSG